MEDFVAKYKDTLKGLCSVSTLIILFIHFQEKQIMQKCLNLDFDHEKLEDWVQSLQVDKKVAGLKEYEWNDTITREEKNISRVRKLADIERKKKRDKIR